MSANYAKPVGGCRAFMAQSTFLSSNFKIGAIDARRIFYAAKIRQGLCAQ